MANKINILHVVTVSFSIPIFFKNQFNYFKNLQNVFVASKDSQQFIELSESYQFQPIKLNINRNISPLNDIVCIIELYQQLKKNKIDIIVGHTPKGALLAMISGFFANTKKRIYFKHGLIFETQKGIKKRILIFLEKITELLSTEIIFVSNSLIQKSILYKLGDPGKYILLQNGTCNGIDSINEFNPDTINQIERQKILNNLNLKQENVVVGFIGRLANDKGINELILAWEKIEKLHNDVILMLVGPIDERDPFDISLIKNLNNIIHIDYVSNPEIYYSIFDIFILPSYREGFPTVNLEASSMKLPVITTKNTGCIDSIIENHTGIFTEIKPNAIFHSIEFYIMNPELRHKHGENGRSYVINNYNQPLIWDSLLKIYFSNYDK